MKIAIALAVISLSTVASASVKIEKCFTRLYSDSHLAKNPNQVIREMKFALAKDKLGTGLTYGIVTARHIDADGSFVASNSGTCSLSGDTYKCYLDADGGAYTVKISGNKALLTVSDAITLSGVDPESETEEEEGLLMLEAGKDNGVFMMNLSRKSACK